MMHRLIKHRGEGDHSLRCAAFPIRDADFFEIKHQFGYTTLYIVVQILNYSVEQHSRDLRALPFLRATLCLDDLIRMLKPEGI
jgi:hypothetical protein